MKATRSAVVDCALVSTLALALGLRSLFLPSLSQDEISAVLYSDLVRHGLVPNRDFFTPYGPAAYWLLATIFQAVGDASIYVSRIFALGLHAFVAIGLYAFATGRGRPAALLAGSVSAILSGLLLQPIPYAWLLGVGAVVLSMATATTRPGLAGALLAVAISARPELALIAIVISGINMRRGTATRWLLGFLLGSLPLLVHLSIARGNVVRNVLLDRLLVDARLPLSGVGASDLLLLGLVLLGVLIVLAQAATSRDRGDICAAACCFLLLPQVFQRVDREHLALVGVVIVPIAAAVLASRLAHVHPRFGRRSWGAAYATISCLVLLGITVGAAAPHASPVSIGGRTVLTRSDAESRAIRQEVGEIQRLVPVDVPVFIGATDMSRSAVTPTYLYFLMPDRVPRAYYLELAPGVAERPESGLLRDVTRQRYLLLSDMSAAQRQRLFPGIRRGSPSVDEYVRREFCPVRDLGSIHILQRCSLRSD